MCAGGLRINKEETESCKNLEFFVLVLYVAKAELGLTM